MIYLFFLLLFPASLFSFQCNSFHYEIDTLQDVDWHVVAGAAIIHVQRPLEDYFVSPQIQKKTFENMKWYASVVSVAKNPCILAPASLQQYIDWKLRLVGIDNDWCPEGREWGPAR